MSHLEIECPSSEIPCGRGQSIQTLQGDAWVSGRRPAPRRRVGRRSDSRGQEAADPGALFPRVIALMSGCVCARKPEDGV